MPALTKRQLLTPLVLLLAALAAFTAVRASASTLSVATPSLPAGEVNVAYTQTVTATGGTAPYTWTLLSGTLPTGISLNPATGLVSGTPTAATTANFTVQVTDASAGTATRALSIVVQPLVSISTLSVPAGQVALSYSQTLAAAGGVGPLAWTVQSGTLPIGLSLNAASGAITGTPTVAGTTNFTARVTDALAQHADQALSLVVNAAGSLAITTASLPNGTIGAAYSQTLLATGGTAPYTWTVSLGALPAGLTLNPTTALLSGTPTASGTATFTVLVTDNAAATAIHAYTLAVSPLTVATSSLAGGVVGAVYSRTLTANGGTSPFTWSVSSGALPSGLGLNATTGVVTGTPTTVGISTLTITVGDALGATASKTFTIQVTDTAKAGAEATGDKVTICHMPPGNMENAHTITVGAPALEAHLAHGDTEGACADAAGAAQSSTEPADDGNGKDKNKQPKTNRSQGRGPK